MTINLNISSVAEAKILKPERSPMSPPLLPGFPGLFSAANLGAGVPFPPPPMASLPMLSGYLSAQMLAEKQHHYLAAASAANHHNLNNLQSPPGTM